MNFLPLSQILILATGAEAHVELPAVGSFDYFVQSNLFNIVLVGILLFFIVRNIQVSQKLKEFQQRTINNIEQAEVEQQKANEQLAALEKRAKGVDTEVQTILKTAEENAKVLANNIVTQAEQDAQRLLENAQKRIILEEKQKADELRKRLMQEAIVAAKELLENTLSKDDKVESVEQFITQLPQVVKGGKD